MAAIFKMATKNNLLGLFMRRMANKSTAKLLYKKNHFDLLFKQIMLRKNICLPFSKWPF